MPTLLSLAGLEPPADRPLDGIDLSPLLLHGKVPSERPLYWASLDNGGNRSEAMRDGPWKLVVQHPGARKSSFENEQVELYRLDQDPSEKTDLAGEQPD
jgi:arylsulfatase A-like enzyme